ncbi:sugar ABC transporter substrate-binding protein [Butyrivibrio sp. NC2002]|uniref:sugar ABC transporter substrate-binding protein n=1 Tax=Butyrivibrio sp. NC2002 TaxID=1410610 RepID=UPI0005683929|nr:extracellular solute-binding protein [Butyrivibrio sp. NC2002]
MKLKFRIIGAACVLLAAGGAIFYAMSGQNIQDEAPIFTAGGKTTVKLWYTDEALTDYLTGKAVEYNNMANDTRVEIELASALEYLENIGKASVEGDDFPDVFITTNDTLEKAYLAGLATEISRQDVLSDETYGYSDAALNAVSYKGKYIAYPYYFETSSLLYNKTYLSDYVKESLQAEIDAKEGEEAQAEIDAGNIDTDEGTEVVAEEETTSEPNEAAGESAISEEELDAAINAELPDTIEDILVFADDYNAPEAVESVFKWDVSDIFCNYFFVGNYLNMGGAAGDDISQIDVYNDNTINCMSFYQQLNQFFAIDEDEVSYDKVIQDFIDGKTVFTVAMSDAVAKIEQAKAEGNCSFDYGVTVMPGLNSTYSTRTMSVTDCLVVNGYSEHPQEADDFACFLATEGTDAMYNMSGKMLAHSKVNYANESLNSFVSVYANSVPLPKMIATSNFWVQLEIAFSNIWDGANVNDTLKSLSESVKLQIGGEAVEEERLADPTVIITDTE